MKTAFDFCGKTKKPVSEKIFLGNIAKAIDILIKICYY